MINNGGGNRAPSGSQALHLLLLSVQQLLPAPWWERGKWWEQEGKEQVHGADRPHVKKRKGSKCQEMLNFTSIVTLPRACPQSSRVWVKTYQSDFNIKLALTGCAAEEMI